MLTKRKLMLLALARNEEERELFMSSLTDREKASIERYRTSLLKNAEKMHKEAEKMHEEAEKIRQKYSK
ncbi:MAG: hypothetical protein J6X85_10290 [Ruminococcus sp.]|nr:hypothetical protein [Ruminococcus sp.]